MKKRFSNDKQNEWQIGSRWMYININNDNDDNDLR